MPLIRFRRRTQAITIILTIAVVAVVGLLLLMSRLAKFETSTTAENELASLTKTEIPANAPGSGDRYALLAS